MWKRSLAIVNHSNRFSKKIWEVIALNEVLLKNAHLYSTSTKDKLMKKIQPRMTTGVSKVTIVGIGRVGMATSFGILAQKVTTELCLADINAEKVSGETLDLLHGSLFLGHCRITKCVDENYKETAGSKLIIITAGARHKPGESSLNVLAENVDIMKSVIPKIVKLSPSAILLIVSTPVDILTYVAWKLSGFPKEKVIGSGTDIDTARFRYLLSRKLQVAPTSCHGWVIGEHGRNSICVWSSANIAGVRLMDLNTKVGAVDDPDNFNDIDKQTVNCANRVIKLKGFTSWAIGITVSAISASILNNVGNIHALSTMVQGYHGITEEVFLSLPVILGGNGITDVVKQILTEEEIQRVHKTAQRISQIQSSIKL